MRGWLAMLLLVSPGGASAAPRDPPPSSVRVTRDRSGLETGLRAENALLTEIGAALERPTGCRVEVDDQLRQQRLTVELIPRPPERLLRVLARRTYTRLSISYHLETAPPDRARRRGSPVFASDPVNGEIDEPLELSEALRKLELRVQVGEGVAGRVRVFAARTPLHRVLDQIAAQVDCVWHTVVRLDARIPVDEAAAEEERERFHFSDLSDLSSAERQEELAADLEAIDRLPPKQRDRAVQDVAADIVSMARLLKETPGEHRGPVAASVHSIGRDYWSVLSRLPPERRTRAAPLFHAVRELQWQLGQIK